MHPFQETNKTENEHGRLEGALRAKAAIRPICSIRLIRITLNLDAAERPFQ